MHATEKARELYLKNMRKMAQFLNALVPACLFLLLVQGARSEKCPPASVEVLQTSNGEKVGVDPVFEVMVRNKCECAVKGVVVRSEGFSSSIPVDPKLFRREGNDYLVGDGRVIVTRGDVCFRYAWDRAFNIGPVVALQEDCAGVPGFPM